VAKAIELATEMMRADARLHTNQTRWHVGKPSFHLATRPLLPQHNRTTLIVADNMERVFTDIDADYGYCGVELVGHSMLLVFGAPSQLKTQAGQEHGRTIPLADIRAGGPPVLPRCDVI